MGRARCFRNAWSDWIVEDNPVRVIDVFVDELDLADLGFAGVDPEVTGRPSYHPSVLLKLYIYGYLDRVQSSRRLEREAGTNVEVMWLTGRLAPDHKTIADFRKDNGKAIRKVCARFATAKWAADDKARSTAASSIGGERSRQEFTRGNGAAAGQLERVGALSGPVPADRQSRARRCAEDGASEGEACRSKRRWPSSPPSRRDAGLPISRYRTDPKVPRYNRRPQIRPGWTIPETRTSPGNSNTVTNAVDRCRT